MLVNYRYCVLYCGYFHPNRLDGPFSFFIFFLNSIITENVRESKREEGARRMEGKKTRKMKGG